MDYFDKFFFCLEFGLLVLKSQAHYVIFPISLQLFILSGKSIFFHLNSSIENIFSVGLCFSTFPR